ncbi:hypothetical protein BC828DRAFT_384713 [Blastocladiella britannica]|nr:hypothetical protein BC828DRAFT_384713 [Blastocladiella britannica]
MAPILGGPSRRPCPLALPFSTFAPSPLLNLTVADFMLASTSFIGQISLLSSQHWDYKWCQYSGWTSTFFGGVALNSLAIIAFERFFSTVKERPLKRPIAFGIVGGVWAEFTLVAALPWILGEEYRIEITNTYCITLWNRSVPAWFTFALIVMGHVALVFSIIGGSYYRIYNKVADIKKQLHGVQRRSKAKKGRTSSTSPSQTGSVFSIGSQVASNSGNSGNNKSMTPSPSSSAGAPLLASSQKGGSLGSSGSTAAASPGSSGAAAAAAMAAAAAFAKSPTRRPSWWRSMFDQGAAVDAGAAPSVAAESPKSGGPAPMTAVANSTAIATGVGDAAVAALAANPAATTAGFPHTGLRKKASSLLRNLPSFRRTQQMDDRRLEAVLFRKAVIITAVFASNWAAYMFIVMFSFITGWSLPNWLHYIATFGVHLNSVTNPVLCLILDTRWVKVAKETLGIGKKPPPTYGSSRGGADGQSAGMRRSNCAAPVKSATPARKPKKQDDDDTNA